MNYFSQWPDLTLMKPDGTRVKAAEVLSEHAYLVVYIGASWVPACQKVTPLVVDFFRRHHVNKDFAVLYISRDTSEGDVMANFMSHAHVDSPPRQPDAPGSPRPARYTPRRRSGGSRHSSAKADVTPPLAEDSQTISTAAIHEGEGATATAGEEKNTTAEAPVASCPATADGYYGLPFEWIEIVAVPLVYHLRVFTYPAVLVLDNTVPIPPAMATPAPTNTTPPVSQAAPADAAHKPQSPTCSTSSSTSNSSQRASGAPPTPRIERRACVPRVLSITGRFMLEVLDPQGDQFPWTTLDNSMAIGRRLFLSVSLIAAAVVVIAVAYLWPAFVTGGPQAQKEREARRLKRDSRG